MRLGYLVHNLNDAAVERRCRMLEAGGAQVTPAGFCRDAEVADALASRGAFSLGQSHDAAMAQRALATAKNALFGGQLRAHFQHCDILIARNLEQLAIASRIADGRPLVYECLDIHRALLGRSLAAKAVQTVEGLLLPKCDLLITSSPAFIRNHFNHRPLDAEAVLVENKVLLDPIDAPLAPRAERPSDRPITVAWFGMLRCKRTLEFLSDLVARSEGQIEVLIAGKPSPAELPDFESRVGSVSGINYLGPYSYSDLPELYAKCDFAWSIDWFEEGLNSKWLLPNRLYEAIAFGAVPIALAEVEVGNWLHRHEAGLVVGNANEAADALRAMHKVRLASLQTEIAAIKEAELVCRLPECRALVDRLSGLRQ